MRKVRVARMSAELFDGIVYWTSEAEYWNPSEDSGDDEAISYVSKDYEPFADWISPDAKQSVAGVFERASGEHGEIWFPCPETVRFIGSSNGGRLLASVHEEGDGWTAYLQPTLGFFFGNAGGVFPIEEGAMTAALQDRIPVGTFVTFEAARVEIDRRGQAYGGYRSVPVTW